MLTGRKRFLFLERNLSPLRAGCNPWATSLTAIGPDALVLRPRQSNDGRVGFESGKCGEELQGFWRSNYTITRTGPSIFVSFATAEVQFSDTDDP